MPLARSSTTRLRWLAIAVGSGICGVLAASLYFAPAKLLDLYLQDLLVERARRDTAGEQFVLITLDEQSLSLRGKLDASEVAESRALQLMQAGYPWSREVYALLAKKLLDAGARVVIFDMLFPSPRAGDAEFAQTLREYPNRIVIGSSFERSPSTQHVGLTYQFTPPTQELREAASTVGFVNFPSHDKGTIRTLWPYLTESVFTGYAAQPGESEVPALATAAANCLGQSVPVSFKPLRFSYARWGFFRTVPLYEIFIPALWQANHKGGEQFKDRVVLVGATAQHLQDFHLTPLGRIPGPVVQLHALSALLRHAWLSEAGSASLIASVLFAGLAAFALIAGRRSFGWLVLGLMAGVCLWMAACALSLIFAAHFLPMAPPLLTWLVCGFAGLACDVSLERRERGRLRGTLERYVSKDVVREIVDNPDSFLQTLGGQRKEIVAMFSDLKGFTSDSERLDPTEMVALLNEYFGEMVQVVFARQGTLDKFMGDAFMATWGCIRPASPEEDALNALTAALDMKERLATMNTSRQTRGAVLWSSGIGICQGPAVFGNIGSQQKMEPTVIGDTVNLASRIEGLTRIYGCDILVNENITVRAAGSFEFLFVDEVRVKGRRRPEKLYFPHRKTDTGWGADFAAAREKYRAGDFGKARDGFGKLSQEGLAPALATRFMKRCEDYLRVPPAEGWDGVWDFVDK